MTILYSYQAKEIIILAEAIKACQEQLKGAIALLYSPDSCQFLKLTGSEFQNSHGDVVNDLRDIFEARIFTPEHELRWLNRENGKGDAVLLTEEPQKTISGFRESQQPIKDTWPQRYLLWGEPVVNSNKICDGWQRLAEARIGKLDIPIDIKLGLKKRVLLKTCEYITTSDDYGNLAVVEERLVKLEVAS